MRDLDMDHLDMRPPHIRLQRENHLVRIWDLRITQPGVGYLDPAVLHTLEHFLGHHLPFIEGKVWMAAPLGCGTGLYIVTSPDTEEAELRLGLQRMMREIIAAKYIPVATPEQCGRPELHDLAGAKLVAGFLERVLLRAGL